MSCHEMRCDSSCTMRRSPHRLPHTTPKSMCDKPSFWMTSNDHFSKQISFVYKLKAFWMINHNDHFIFKTMFLFVGSGFLVFQRGLRKPIHFYGLSPPRTMSNHNWRVFHPRGDLSLLVDTRHIFSLPFNSTVRLCWMLSHLRSPPNQTPNVVSIYQPCTHTDLMRCPHAYAMQKFNCMNTI